VHVSVSCDVLNTTGAGRSRSPIRLPAGRFEAKRRAGSLVFDQRWRLAQSNVAAATESPQPAVLAVGCFDASGKTGLLRDYLAAKAMGSSTLLVPTAFALEGGDGARLHVRPVASVVGDVEAALVRVSAIKIGLLGSIEIVLPLAKALARFRGPVVYDPVLTEPGGGALPEGSLDALQALLVQASLVSPDVADAGRLTGATVDGYESARVAATHLRSRGAAAVLIKRATLPNESVDVLAQEEGESHFASPLRDGHLPRGTGSAMATAIAVGLTRGLSIRGAVREAHAWLHGQIAAAERAGSADWL
jgi:hydroxymethylpyrimidine/phosphomethylpyrimidine kinase